MEKNEGDDSLELDLELDIIRQKVIVDDLLTKKGILCKIDLYLAKNDLQLLEELLQNLKKFNPPD